jgi:lantibiotic modifying enzyme
MPESPSRRDMLRAGLGAAAALVALPRELWPATAPSDRSLGERPYFDAAVKAARFIARSAMTTEHGIVWPADPRDPKSVEPDLYNGYPGVVLFLLELHAVTGERTYLDQACAGASHLAATLPAKLEGEGAGLYTGIAGAAFVLNATARASGRADLAAAARAALGTLMASARAAGAGVEWNESTDIISGSSGIGLFLLDATRWSGGSATRALAVKAGHRLIELGKREGEGVTWMMSPTFAANMPNFSHGTAGVAYFLATLHAATGDPAFLDAAKQGARYLEAIATTTPNDGRMVYHHAPDGKELYYLSWCHGPAGTARLYHRLGDITHDPAYSGYVDRLARGIIANGIPEQRTPGFWNNISQCCGNCGVSEFFISLYQARRNADHLAFARRVAADTLRRGSDDDGALKWVQAEHRVKPELLIAQTGLMQGAAGVGLAMLRLDGVEQKRARRIVLPDDPFIA